MPLKQGNIFAPKGAQKIPFDFIRSNSNKNDKLPLPKSLGVVSLRTRLNALGSESFPLAMPFRVFIEQQSVSDLPHVRLVVVMVQGKTPSTCR